MFIGKFYQIFKEEIIPILYNFIQKTEAEGLFPNSLYKDGITQRKNIQEKKTIDEYLLRTQMKNFWTKC